VVTLASARQSAEGKDPQMTTAATVSTLRESVGLKNASRRTDIPYGTLRQYVSDGVLPAYRVGTGHRLYVFVEDIERLFVPIEPKHQH
jgi:excisionase family DNA binding protein